MLLLTNRRASWLWITTIVGMAEEFERYNMSTLFRPGTVVVYRKQKSSPHPGPHARDIQPAPHGDDYSYTVDKFWRVVAVVADDTLVVRTRRGKQHTIAASDPNLRPTHWWERLFLRHRFPTPSLPLDTDETSLALHESPSAYQTRP
jgi:hypothetical protein